MSSDMTANQVNKAVSNYRTMLEKHAPNFPADAVQEALGDSAFAAAQFNLFRQAVEARAKIVTREFRVDPRLVGMAAIDATGRTQYVDKKVVAAMPHAIATNGLIHFFSIGRYVPVGEVDAEYTKRGLVAIDPHSLAAFNAKHSEFADTYPNGTQWVVDGKFCYAAFRRWFGKRSVIVSQSDDGWDGHWLLAGVKPSELTA